MKRTIPFRFSGRIAPGSPLHSTKEEAPPDAIIPPVYISTAQGSVPQYAPTAKGIVDGFDPAGDCEGHFLPFKYQANNNCYAYACCMATNTFPQPGRNGGAGPNEPMTAKILVRNAESDGLQFVGHTLADVQNHAQSHSGGHYVALLISEPEDVCGDPGARWPGDYHWVRCDDSENFTSWSQKHGDGQVSELDFAGNSITNPANANWTVNHGPIGKGNEEYHTTYVFRCFLYVPETGVRII